MKVLHMITIMISTVSTIGTYPMLDTNTIHKKRPSTLCTRSFLYHLRVIGQKVCVTNPNKLENL